MATELTWNAVLAWRTQRQMLVQRAPADRWLEVVRTICGLHAQVQSSAELTLCARVDGLDPSTVERALWTDRTLVRTWAMRGTLHLLRADELAIYTGAQGALKPRWETASWRKAFGMTGDEAVAVLDAIRAALDGERLTRDELADAVTEILGDKRLGETVRGSWGTMPKLAAFRGDLCFAPSRGRQVCFTRPDRWLGDSWKPAPPAQALAEVLRRYLSVYGPATRESFARWFGMSSAAQAGKLLKGLGDEVAPVVVGGEFEALMLAADIEAAAQARPAGTVALLPGFDQYVVAAPREDSPVLAAEHKAKVYRPQGWLSPVLLVDGRIAGVWRHERKSLSVQITPFDEVSAPVRAAAESEARRMTRFLGWEDPEVSWAG